VVLSDVPDDADLVEVADAGRLPRRKKPNTNPAKITNPFQVSPMLSYHHKKPGPLQGKLLQICTSHLHHKKIPKNPEKQPHNAPRSAKRCKFNSLSSCFGRGRKKTSENAPIKTQF